MYIFRLLIPNSSTATVAVDLIKSEWNSTEEPFNRSATEVSAFPNQLSIQSLPRGNKIGIKMNKPISIN